MSGQRWRRWISPEERRFSVVVMTEEHLPGKWLREVKQTVPLACAAIARSPEEVTTFARKTRQVDQATMCVLIIPKSMAKLGSGWTGAYVRRRMSGRRLYACPRCGEICKEEDEAGQPTYPVTDVEWFHDRKRRCHACEEPLWQVVRLKDHLPYFPAPERTLFGRLRNPPAVR